MVETLPEYSPDLLPESLSALSISESTRGVIATIVPPVLGIIIIVAGIRWLWNKATGKTSRRMEHAI